ncbi:MAG TPA: hypothetical protein VEW91_12635 [bacterium]|nr:hypothetical protein [bacterium]
MRHPRGSEDGRPDAAAADRDRAQAGVLLLSGQYEPGASEEIVPARIAPALARKAQQLAVRAHRALGCEGLSRVDMFARKGGIVLLEVNTIPGLTPGSLLPKAAAAAGLDFPELVNRIIQGALRRQRQRRRGRGA